MIYNDFTLVYTFFTTILLIYPVDAYNIVSKE